MSHETITAGVQHQTYDHPLMYAPPDTCPNDLCGNVNVIPHTHDQETDKVRGHYTCAVCYQQWETLWRIREVQ